MRKLAVSCISLLLLASCGGEKQKPMRPAALVEAEPAAQAQFFDVVDAVGTALANEQVVLSAPVTERVTAVNFADGGFVAKGQVVATLERAQETAALEAAQARVRETQLQLNRIEALKDRGFATNASLDSQVAAANEARASAAQASATIGDRVIRAPFSGWASIRTVSPGAIVAAGTPIATISDVSRIKLDFTVPETQLSEISERQPIDAKAAAFPGRVFQGTIATIDPAIDPTTRAVRVRAILPNPDRAIKPGMLMTVRVLARPRKALAVRELSIVGDGEDRFVYIADDSGKAKRVKVVTGVSQNGLVEIVSGLTPGQKVVTEGVVKLSDGVPIRLAGAGKDQEKAAGDKAPAKAGG